MTVEPVQVRPVAPTDQDQWSQLYREYRDFYRMEPDDAVVQRVWGWVLDPGHEVNSLVAVAGTTLVGLANSRRFARPSSGTVGLYLDDLFTAPTVRGRGVGRALLAAVAEQAAAQGLSVVRWITAKDNERARRLYDTVADGSRWVTYDLLPGAPVTR